MSKKGEPGELDDADSDFLGEGLLEDTIEKEKTQILDLCTRLGKYCTCFLIATSILSALLGIQLFLGSDSLLSSELQNIFPVTLGFIGAVNLVSGLLLLGKNE